MNKKISRLEEKYRKEIKSKLKEEFSIENPMAVPKITKVVVNMGIGDSLKDKSLIDQAVEDFKKITGQTPSFRQARISVASFGLRKGMKVGLKVTLRREKMYSFLDKLFSIVLPRLRDFKGVADDSFDGSGNYTLGIYDHTVFPEIDITKTKPRGFEITIVTNAKEDEKAAALLKYLGMPFVK